LGAGSPFSSLWTLDPGMQDRPGHDRIYALDGSWIGRLGWTLRVGPRLGVFRLTAVGTRRT